MTIFDVLFLAVALGSLLTLALITFCALLGRRAQARRLLRLFAIAAASYLGVVLLVSPLAPRRELMPGEPLCFDDWCITVDGIERTAAVSERTYLVRLRLSSRARGRAQRENGLVVYLTDARDRRFEALPDPAAPPFNTLLQPQESVLTQRIFRVPSDVQTPALAIAHEGGFPIGWLIVGEGPFHKAPIVRLDAVLSR
jgi:hypothetical protein